MERDTVELLSRLAQKIASMKVHLGILQENSPTEYMQVREHMNDCQEMMAIYCDCAPIKLIAGQVDDILENYNYMKSVSYSRT